MYRYGEYMRSIYKLNGRIKCVCGKFRNNQQNLGRGIYILQPAKIMKINVMANADVVGSLCFKCVEG